jgi:hypothetical protein
MKKYNQFINESSKNKFRFAINIEGITDEQTEQLIDKLKTYNLSYNDEHTIRRNVKTPGYYAIIVEVSKYSEYSISISSVSTRGWGDGIDYMQNMLSVDDFLAISFDDIYDDIQTKIHAKKYNI